MGGDPWRYVCTRCGSHSLEYRVTTGFWYCGECHLTMERRYDKKHKRLETKRSSIQ